MDDESESEGDEIGSVRLPSLHDRVSLSAREMRRSVSSFQWSSDLSTTSNQSVRSGQVSRAWKSCLTRPVRRSSRWARSLPGRSACRWLEPGAKKAMLGLHTLLRGMRHPDLTHLGVL